MSRIDHVLSISRSFFFFPAFFVGACFGPELNRWLCRPAIRRGAGLLLVAAAAFAWVTRDWIQRGWILGSVGYVEIGATQWWAGAWRLAAVIGGIMLALAAMSVLSSRRTWVTRFGAFTLYAYLLHIIIRQLNVTYWTMPVDSGVVGLVAVMAAAGLLTFVLMSAPVRAVTWPAIEPRRTVQWFSRQRNTGT